jgi:hypothetical protein
VLIESQPVQASCSLWPLGPANAAPMLQPLSAGDSRHGNRYMGSRPASLRVASIRRGKTAVDNGFCATSESTGGLPNQPIPRDQHDSFLCMVSAVCRWGFTGDSGAALAERRVWRCIWFDGLLLQTTWFLVFFLANFTKLTQLAVLSQ